MATGRIRRINDHSLYTVRKSLFPLFLFSSCSRLPHLPYPAPITPTRSIPLYSGFPDGDERELNRRAVKRASGSTVGSPGSSTNPNAGALNTSGNGAAGTGATIAASQVASAAHAATSSASPAPAATAPASDGPIESGFAHSTFFTYEGGKRTQRDAALHGHRVAGNRARIKARRIPTRLTPFFFCDVTSPQDGLCAEADVTEAEHAKTAMQPHSRTCCCTA